MNILLIAYACEPNKGSEPGVGWNWALHLSKYVKVTVVTRANNKESITSIPHVLKQSSHNLSFIYYDLPFFYNLKNRIPFGIQFYYFLWQLFFTFSNRNMIRKFDIVHHITFNSFSIPSFVCFYSKNFIWGPIGGGQSSPLKLINKFGSKALYELLRTIIVQLNKYNPLIIINSSKAKRVIVANKETKSKILFSKKIIKMLETGINEINCLEVVPMKYQDEMVKILWIGNLEPHKAPFLLLDALAKVKAKVCTSIIGSGSLKRELEKKLQISLCNEIEFVDNISHSKIWEYYRDADIFVFTSIRDTSGNVVLEAMSQGLPIIAFDHQGMHDILTDECAIKIPVTNYKEMVQSLTAAIDKLANDSELRIRMGNAAIDRIRENYLWEDKAKRMVDIYKEVLNENSPST